MYSFVSPTGRIHGPENEEWEWALPASELTEKGVTVLGGPIDPDYQREMGLLSHSRDKEEGVWSTGDS